MKVYYFGDIWTSTTWINQGIFDNYQKTHPKDRILITRNGTTRSVEILYVKLVSGPKKERRNNEHFHNG